MQLPVDRPVPRSLTICAGIENEREQYGGRQFCLWKDNQMLVIQMPSTIPPEYMGFGQDPALDKLVAKDCDLAFEKVLTLASSGIAFGHTNWAFLVEREKGVYSLSYREKQLNRVSCPPWAPLVPEGDILITAWLSPDDRRGIWNGQEVDLFMGWNDRWRQILDWEMTGHRLLRGLDLTYEVLGHVVDAKGEIIGLMTERCTGRPIEYGDRADLYNAIAKIESRSVYYSFDSSMVFISDGKIRFHWLSSIRTFKRDDAADVSRVQKFHWKQLDDIFDELSQRSNHWLPFRYFASVAIPLSIIPRPDRPLRTDIDTRIFSLLVQFEASSDSFDHASISIKLSYHSKPRHTRKPQDGSSRTVLLADRDYSRPLEGIVSLPRRRRPYKPYRLPSRMSVSSKVLISSRCSDQTSESG